MSLLISGSIAFDTIIQTVGDFRSQDTQKTGDLHLSLFSPTIRKEYGGTAANIAYSLALLGKTPTIIGSVGEDANDYLIRLRELWIHTELIQQVPGSYSPQAYIIRDGANGQINTFHPGAMSQSGEITHGSINFQYTIVSPDAKEGMIRRVQECTEWGIFTIFDPGQALGIFSREELIECTTLSQITIMNEPERTQFETISGYDPVDLCQAHGRICIITLGEKGSDIFQEGIDGVHIASLYTTQVIDATGCGDAYRAGLLYGLSEWWDIKKSCILGSILWGIKIQYIGGQNHTITKEQIQQIGVNEFNTKFFA
jgi:adenosine kinase